MCYEPNVLFFRRKGIIRKDGEKGTQRINIIFSKSPEFKGYEYYLNKNEKLKKENPEYGYKLIPCGKCLACKKQEKLTWATRIELEAKQYKNNYFITLTYNENNILIPEKMYDTETGEIMYENDGSWKGTLVKEDLQRFMNSYRKWLERDYNWEGIKFYACGEYGEIGERPHYHIIMMNNPNLEQEIIGKNSKGIYHTNKRIEKIWGKGFITIEKANWDTIACCICYCQKKLYGELKIEHYGSRGQIPIFAQMSRRPGIGRAYYEEHKENIYKCDEIINSKGKSVKPPSYFDRLMDAGEHDFMESIKEKRTENAENRLKNKIAQTSLTLQEQLQIEKRTAEDKEKKYRKEYKIL